MRLLFIRFIAVAIVLSQLTNPSLARSLRTTAVFVPTTSQSVFTAQAFAEAAGGVLAPIIHLKLAKIRWVNLREPVIVGTALLSLLAATGKSIIAADEKAPSPAAELAASSKGVVEDLIQKLDPEKSKLALTQLKSLPPDEALTAELLNVYRTSEDKTILDRITRLLMERYKHDPEIAKHLLPLLDDPSPIRRGWAQLTVAQLGVAKMWDVLKAAGRLEPRTNLPTERGKKTKVAVIIVDRELNNHLTQVVQRVVHYASPHKLPMSAVTLTVPMMEADLSDVEVAATRNPLITVTHNLQLSIQRLVEQNPDTLFIVNVAIKPETSPAERIGGLFEVSFVEKMARDQVVFVVPTGNTDPGLRSIKNLPMDDLFPPMDNVLYVVGGNINASGVTPWSVVGRHAGYAYVTADEGLQQGFVGNSFAVPNVTGRIARKLLERPSMSVEEAKKAVHGDGQLLKPFNENGIGIDIRLVGQRILPVLFAIIGVGAMVELSALPAAAAGLGAHAPSQDSWTLVTAWLPWATAGLLAGATVAAWKRSKTVPLRDMLSAA